LLVADCDGPLAEPAAEKPLCRFAGLPIDVGPAETAAQKRLDGVRSKRVRHSAEGYTTAAVQPVAAPPRQTHQDALPGRLLAYRKLSDVDLVTKATHGDGTALDTLLERYAPRVQRLAAQVIGDIEEARDAAQESLVKVCTRLRQFRGEAQFATWLHRLVVNTCRDRLAHQRLRLAEPLSAADDPRDDEDVSRAAALTDLRRDLVDALGRLSAKQRLAVVLRDAFGFTYEEISRIARMPVGTAKCYVHRARARLRPWLEENAEE
jgi:RNA polymerase sigma-70 factor (ECF subfamily)